MNAQGPLRLGRLLLHLSLSAFLDAIKKYITRPPTVHAVRGATSQGFGCKAAFGYALRAIRRRADPEAASPKEGILLLQLYIVSYAN
jgi:hypothetical protein